MNHLSIYRSCLNPKRDAYIICHYFLRLEKNYTWNSSWEEIKKWKRERKRERERERQTDRQTDRQRDRQRQREECTQSTLHNPEFHESEFSMTWNSAKNVSKSIISPRLELSWIIPWGKIMVHWWFIKPETRFFIKNN